MGLVRGNDKLGKIWHWALRSGPDCPGKTIICSKHCYAGRGNFAWPSVKQAHDWNYEMSRRPNFAGWLSKEIRDKKIAVLRVHTDGDIYNKRYAKKLLRVFRLNPQTKFFLYTRSWRVKSIRPVLEKMAALKNVQLWYSVDCETGWPTRRHRRIKLAYMQVSETDLPKRRVHLVFRIGKLRGKVVKKVAARDGREAMVCPPENGITVTQCDKCKTCFRQAQTEPAEPKNRRVALALLC